MKFLIDNEAYDGDEEIIEAETREEALNTVLSWLGMRVIEYEGGGLDE